MYFSFVSITYNHEKFINAHLESIKYQIQNFGKEFKCNLFISDDCSTDNTIYLINKWVEANKSIFNEIKILESGINLGIVQNYIKAIKLIKTDYFKILAGDDMYSCNNIFELVDYLKEYDFVFGNTIQFKNYEILTERKYYSNYIEWKNYDYKTLKRNYNMAKFSIVAPSIFFKRKFITEGLFDFLSNFKMVEDTPLFWYLINKYIMKFHYYLTPYVLYRESESSIARNKNHPHKIIANQDNIILLNYLKLQKKNFLVKYHLLVNEKEIKMHISGNKKYLFYLYKFTDILRIYFKIKRITKDCIFKKEIEKYFNFQKNEFKKNQIYLKYIETKVNEFNLILNGCNSNFKNNINP